MAEKIVQRSDDRAATLDKLSDGITALQVAIDTLWRVAEFGGVQGEWALQTLERIGDILRTGYQRVPRDAESEREQREDSFLPTAAALRIVGDPLDAATGQGRR